MPTPDKSPAVVTDGTGNAADGLAVGQPVAASSATPSGVIVQNRLTVLDGLAERPLHEHAEVYQRLHADLQAALAEIDGA